MSNATTGGVVGGTQRKVTAVVRRAGNKQKAVYKFLPAPKPGEGRAAKWLQHHLPIDRVVDDAHAVLKDGRALEVTGCTIRDLYPTQPAPAPLLPLEAPEPEPLPSKAVLKKTTPAGLKVLCERRGIAITGKTSKAKMIEALLAR